MEYPGLKRLIPLAIVVGVASLLIHYLPAGTAESDALLSVVTVVLASLGWSVKANGGDSGG